MAKQDTNQSKQKKLQLTITTPRGVKFVESADMVIMRSIDGDLGVLPSHAPLTTVLGDGVLRIRNNGSEKQLALFGGVAEIDDLDIKIFSTIAQRPDEIDLERAEEDRLQAEAALNEEREEQMSRRLQVMQVRALVRLQVGNNTDYFDDPHGEFEEDNK